MILALLTWLARGLLGLVALGWLATLLQVIVRTLKPKWALTPQDPPAPPGVPVAVIIPARNEVDNLGPCLDTARAQDHADLQIVVLDDGSTDGTDQILADHAARDARITPLRGGESLPDGWFGKPWALQRAQQSARGEWLVFIDADVRLHPGAVSRAVGYGIREGVDMVTGLGKQGAETFWERVLQPAVGGLILAGNDLDRVNDPAQKDKNLANGQFIAVRREAYDAIGGHAAVKQDILDDIGLARALVAAGRTYRCLMMRQLFYCRMYTSLAEIWEGWTKNLFAGMRYSWGAVAGALIFTFLFTQLGPLLLVAGLLGAGREWLTWGLLLTGLMQLVRLIMDVRFGLPARYGLTHAPANLLVMAMILHSGLRTGKGGVTWKGRTYQPTRALSADAKPKTEEEAV